MMHANSHVLTVIGMHRSGTSVAANWLAKCGLFIGDKLLYGYRDNPRGHYEDMDFLNLHNSILKDNGMDYRVRGKQHLQIDGAYHTRATKLVAQRMVHKEWGWKEPRTTLFLDFWKEHIPHLRGFIIYRDVVEVVNSLLQRDLLRELQRHPELNLLKKCHWLWHYSFANPARTKWYFQVWNRYNYDALRFVKRYPNDSLVVNLEDLPVYSNEIMGWINKEWGFSLEPLEFSSSVYHGEDLHRSRSAIKNLLGRLLVPDNQVIVDELYDWRDRTLARIGVLNS